jgi:hypothetical protein
VRLAQLCRPCKRTHGTHVAPAAQVTHRGRQVTTPVLQAIPALVTARRRPRHQLHLPQRSSTLSRLAHTGDRVPVQEKVARMRMRAPPTLRRLSQGQHHTALRLAPSARALCATPPAGVNAVHPKHTTAQTTACHLYNWVSTWTTAPAKTVFSLKQGVAIAQRHVYHCSGTRSSCARRSTAAFADDAADAFSRSRSHHTHTHTLTPHV